MDQNKLKKVIDNKKLYAYASAVVFSVYANNLLTQTEYDGVINDLKTFYKITS